MNDIIDEFIDYIGEDAYNIQMDYNKLMKYYNEYKHRLTMNEQQIITQWIKP